MVKNHIKISPEKKTEWYDSLPQETKDRMAWSRGKIDEELLIAIKNNKNIRQALMSVGLTPKGGNYERAYNLKNGACGEMADTADLIKN